MNLSRNKTIRTKKDIFFEVAGIVFLICAIIYFFFFNENLRVILYAPVIYLIIFIGFLRKYYSKTDYFYHVVALFLTYIILTLIFRSSPLLQLKEFEWTHPHWQKLENVQLLQQEVSISSRKNGHAYSTIVYEYSYQGQPYVIEQSDLCRQYSFIIGEEYSDLKHWSQDKVKQGYLNQQYVALVNSHQPEESIYFYSQDVFDIRGSWFAKLLYLIQILLVGGVIALFGWGIKRLVDRKDQIKKMPKMKKILLISVLAISLWLLLFIGWMAMMVIINS